MACNNGGEVDYSFSELVFPVTLSYNNCSTVKVHADNNSAASLKNGVLKISGSEINATIIFQGDFNNTVVTNDDKSFETIVSGTSVINSRNVSTYTNRYENIVNISIVANGTTFETNNATYGLTYSDDLLNVVGYTGTVISSIGERISIAMWRTRVTYPPKVVRLNREGDFIDGSLLYKYGSSHTEIFVSDINTFKLNERSIENISAYLW
jgi:hypothetical protein